MIMCLADDIRDKAEPRRELRLPPRDTDSVLDDCCDPVRIECLEVLPVGEPPDKPGVLLDDRGPVVDLAIEIGPYLEDLPEILVIRRSG